jgi:hypothetical protein
VSPAVELNDDALLRGLDWRTVPLSLADEGWCVLDPVAPDANWGLTASANEDALPPLLSGYHIGADQQEVCVEKPVDVLGRSLLKSRSSRVDD